MLIRDASTVFLSQFGAALVLFLNSLALARLTSPGEFGALTALLALSSIAVGLTDLGLTVTVVRLVGKYADGDIEHRRSILGLTLLLECALGLVIVVVALIGAPWIVDRVFHSQQYLAAVKYILLGGAFLSTGAYVPAVLQSHKRFGLMAVLTVSGAIVRAVATIVAFVTFRTIEAVALAYCLGAAVSVAAGFVVVVRLYTPRLAFASPRLRDAAREVFDFGKWVALTVVLTTLLARLDVILLASIGNAVQVALYGAAVQLIMIGPLSVNTLSTVLLPAASGIRTRDDLMGYIRHSVALACLPVAAFVVLFALAEPLVSTLYGPTFVGAVSVFRISLVTYSITSLAWPFLLLVYRADRPDIQCKVNAAQLVALIVGNWWLIPRLGARAPAIVFLVITIAGVAATGIYLALLKRPLLGSARATLSQVVP